MKQTLSADGQSGVFEGNGGPVTVSASGTFGGGTVTIQYSRDGGITWPFVESGISWTSAQIASVTLGAGVWMRFSLAGATTPAVLVEAG